MQTVLYSLNTNRLNDLQIIESLPNHAIHTVVFEVDEKVFPLKTLEETKQYLLTYYKDKMHTKLLPGFRIHEFL